MKRPYRATLTKIDQQTSRIAALGLLALLLSLALTGCKHSSQNAALLNPVGIYTLISVDDRNVPCLVKHHGVDLSITSGTFTITTNGQCHSVMIFAPPNHAEVRREVSATYTQNGRELTMQWERAGVTKGRLNDNQFTMNNEGMVLTYQK
jgi:hypothetical protein